MKPLRSGAHAKLVEGVEGHIEEIRHSLIVEIKRLAQLQEQVDEVRLAIRELKAAPSKVLSRGISIVQKRE